MARKYTTSTELNPTEYLLDQAKHSRFYSPDKYSQLVAAGDPEAIELYVKEQAIFASQKPINSWDESFYDDLRGDEFAQEVYRNAQYFETDENEYAVTMEALTEARSAAVAERAYQAQSGAKKFFTTIGYVLGEALGVFAAAMTDFVKSLVDVGYYIGTAIMNEGEGEWNILSDVEGYGENFSFTNYIMETFEEKGRGKSPTSMKWSGLAEGYTVRSRTVEFFQSLFDNVAKMVPAIVGRAVGSPGLVMLYAGEMFGTIYESTITDPEFIKLGDEGRTAEQWALIAERLATEYGPELLFGGGAYGVGFFDLATRVSNKILASGAMTAGRKFAAAAAKVILDAAQEGTEEAITEWLQCGLDSVIVDGKWEKVDPNDAFMAFAIGALSSFLISGAQIAVQQQITVGDIKLNKFESWLAGDGLNNLFRDTAVSKAAAAANVTVDTFLTDSKYSEQAAKARKQDDRAYRTTIAATAILESYISKSSPESYGTVTEMVSNSYEYRARKVREYITQKQNQANWDAISQEVNKADPNLVFTPVGPSEHSQAIVSNISAVLGMQTIVGEFGAINMADGGAPFKILTLDIADENGKVMPHQVCLIDAQQIKDSRPTELLQHALSEQAFAAGVAKMLPNLSVRDRLSLENTLRVVGRIGKAPWNRGYKLETDIELASVALYSDVAMRAIARADRKVMTELARAIRKHVTDPNAEVLKRTNFLTDQMLQDMYLTLSKYNDLMYSELVRNGYEVDTDQLDGKSVIEKSEILSEAYAEIPYSESVWSYINELIDSYVSQNGLDVSDKDTQELIADAFCDVQWDEKSKKFVPLPQIDPVTNDQFIRTKIDLRKDALKALGKSKADAEAQVNSTTTMRFGANDIISNAGMYACNGENAASVSVVLNADPAATATTGKSTVIKAGSTIANRFVKAFERNLTDDVMAEKYSKFFPVLKTAEGPSLHTALTEIYNKLSSGQAYREITITSNGTSVSAFNDVTLIPVIYHEFRHQVADIFGMDAGTNINVVRSIVAKMNETQVRTMMRNIYEHRKALLDAGVFAEDGKLVKKIEAQYDSTNNFETVTKEVRGLLSQCIYQMNYGEIYARSGRVVLQESVPLWTTAKKSETGVNEFVANQTMKDLGFTDDTVEVQNTTVQYLPEDVKGLWEDIDTTEDDRTRERQAVTQLEKLFENDYARSILGKLYTEIIGFDFDTQYTEGVKNGVPVMSWFIPGFTANPTISLTFLKSLFIVDPELFAEYTSIVAKGSKALIRTLIQKQAIQNIFADPLMRETYGDAFLEKFLDLGNRYPASYGFKSTIKETLAESNDINDLTAAEVDDPLVTIGAFSGTRAREVAKYSFTLGVTIREASKNISGFLKDGDLNGIFDINAYSLEGVDTIRSVLADKTNPKFHHEYNITEDYFSGDTWSRTVNWYLMKRYSVMYDPVTKSFVPMFSVPTQMFSGVKKAYTVDGKEVEIDFTRHVTPTAKNTAKPFGKSPFEYTNYVGNDAVDNFGQAIVVRAEDIIDLSNLPKELRVRYKDIPIVFAKNDAKPFTIDGRPFGLRANIPIRTRESYYDGEVIVVAVDTWFDEAGNPATIAAHEFGHAITDIGSSSINITEFAKRIDKYLPEGTSARTTLAEALAAALGTPNDVKSYMDSWQAAYAFYRILQCERTTRAPYRIIAERFPTRLETDLSTGRINRVGKFADPSLNMFFLGTLPAFTASGVYFYTAKTNAQKATDVAYQVETDLGLDVNETDSLRAYGFSDEFIDIYSTGRMTNNDVRRLIYSDNIGNADAWNFVTTVLYPNEHVSEALPGTIQRNLKDIPELLLIIYSMGDKKGTFKSSQDVMDAFNDVLAADPNVYTKYSKLVDKLLTNTNVASGTANVWLLSYDGPILNYECAKAYVDQAKYGFTPDLKTTAIEVTTSEGKNVLVTDITGKGVTESTEDIAIRNLEEQGVDDVIPSTELGITKEDFMKRYKEGIERMSDKQRIHAWDVLELRQAKADLKAKFGDEWNDVRKEMQQLLQPQDPKYKLSTIHQHILNRIRGWISKARMNNIDVSGLPQKGVDYNLYTDTDTLMLIEETYANYVKDRINAKEVAEVRSTLNIKPENDNARAIKESVRKKAKKGSPDTQQTPIDNMEDVPVKDGVIPVVIPEDTDTDVDTKTESDTETKKVKKPKKPKKPKPVSLFDLPPEWKKVFEPKPWKWGEEYDYASNLRAMGFSEDFIEHLETPVTSDGTVINKFWVEERINSYNGTNPEVIGNATAWAVVLQWLYPNSQFKTLDQLQQALYWLPRFASLDTTSTGVRDMALDESTVNEYFDEAQWKQMQTTIEGLINDPSNKIPYHLISDMKLPLTVQNVYAFLLKLVRNTGRHGPLGAAIEIQQATNKLTPEQRRQVYDQILLKTGKDAHDVEAMDQTAKRVAQKEVSEIEKRKEAYKLQQETNLANAAENAKIRNAALAEAQEEYEANKNVKVEKSKKGGRLIEATNLTTGGPDVKSNRKPKDYVLSPNTKERFNKLKSWRPSRNLRPVTDIEQFNNAFKAQLMEWSNESIVDFMDMVRAKYQNLSDYQRLAIFYTLATLYEFNQNMSLTTRDIVGRFRKQLSSSSGTLLAAQSHVENTQADADRYRDAARKMGIVADEELLAAFVDARRSGDYKKAMEVQQQLLLDMANKIPKIRELLKQKRYHEALKIITRRINSFRYTAMLSNPATHVRNLTSNIALSGINEVSERFAQYLATKINEKLGIKGEFVLTAKRRKFKDIPSDVRAYIDQKIINNGRLDAILKGSKFNPTSDNIIENISNAYPFFGDDVVNKALQKWYSFTFDMLEKGDVIFVGREIQIRLAQYLESLNKDLKDITKDDFEMVFNMAVADSWELYLRKSNNFTKWYAKMSYEFPVLGLLFTSFLPFAKVTANITSFLIRFSPFNWVKVLADLAAYKYQTQTLFIETVETRVDPMTGKTYEALIQKKVMRGGDADKARQRGSQLYDIVPQFANIIGRDISSATIGTVLFAMGIAAGLSGVLDWDEDTYGNLVIRVGDYAITIDLLSPGISALLLGASITSKTKMNDKTWDTFADVLSNLTLLGTFDNILRYNDNVGDVVASAWGTYLLQYVPALFKSIARVIDPSLKKTGSKWYYRLAAALPGFTYLVPNRIDPYTGEYVNDDGTHRWLNLMQIVLPTRIIKESTNYLELEAIRLGTTTTGPSGRLQYNDDVIVLTGKEKEQYKQRRGAYVRSIGNKMVSSKEYLDAPDELSKETKKATGKRDRKDMLEWVYSKASKYAKIEYWLNQGNTYTTSSAEEYQELVAIFGPDKIKFRKSGKLLTKFTK
nr:MAG TPA: Thermolysin metallopeptidase, catalytic domain [Caudoviricetes sp.]